MLKSSETHHLLNDTADDIPAPQIVPFIGLFNLNVYRTSYYVNLIDVTGGNPSINVGGFPVPPPHYFNFSPDPSPPYFNFAFKVYRP